MENQNRIGVLKKLTHMDQLILLLVVLVLCVLMSIMSPVFMTYENLMNLFRQVSFIGITGLGMTLIMLVGEVDLSVGSMQAVMGVMVVSLIQVSDNVLLSIIITLACGAAIGFGQAMIVTRMKVNSLITTLATMSILKGAIMIITQATSIPNNNALFKWIGTGSLILPLPVIIFIILFIIVFYIIKNFTFGRYLYAVGGNAQAASLSGININKYKILAFTIGGVFTTVSAILLAARLNSGQPHSGIGFEFLVLSAVILGGVSLSGGRGTLPGMLLGIMILGIMNNGLVLLNVSSFYQDVLRGIVLILAVFFDERRRASIKQKSLVVQ